MTRRSDLPDAQTFIPLTPTALNILLALSGEARHGYAIMKAVDSTAGATEELRPGTLYRALARLLEGDLVAETDGPRADASDDERRRYYMLTTLGRRVLVAELSRLRQVVDSALARRALRDSGVT